MLSSCGVAETMAVGEAMKKNRDSEEFLASKRARKRWRRRQRMAKVDETRKERKAENARLDRASRLFALGWRLSPHLRRLASSATDKPKGPAAVVKIPQTFSIIEAPELALQTIGNLVAAGARTDVFRVDFDHREVERFDLAAEAILMRVARELELERSAVEHELNFEGHYPKSEPAKRFAAAMGVGTYLLSSHEYRRRMELEKMSGRALDCRERRRVAGRSDRRASRLVAEVVAPCRCA